MYDLNWIVNLPKSSYWSASVLEVKEGIHKTSWFMLTSWFILLKLTSDSELHKNNYLSKRGLLKNLTKYLGDICYSSNLLLVQSLLFKLKAFNIFFSWGV